MPAFPQHPLLSTINDQFSILYWKPKRKCSLQMHMRRRHIAYPPYGHSHTRSRARRPRKWTCDGHQWQAWCRSLVIRLRVCACACALLFLFFFWWVGEVEEDRVRVLKSSSLRARRSRSVQRNCQRTAELLSRRGRRTRAVLRLCDAAYRGGR